MPPNLGTNAGVYYTPSTMQNQTGVSTTPQAAASSLYQPPTQYTPPTQQFVPTTTQTAPSAKEFLKGDEAASRVETIINPDTGEEKQITFIPGVTQIPEGFMLKRDYQPEEKVTSQTSRTQSTGVIQNDASSIEVNVSPSVFDACPVAVTGAPNACVTESPLNETV